MEVFGLVLLYSASFAVTLINILAMWRIFKLNKQPGWASIIPVYNIIVMCKIAKVPLWYVILMFVPVANIVVSILLYINFADKIGRKKIFGLGLVLLPFIFFPIAAYTGKNEPKKLNKVFYAILTILFGWVGINKIYEGNIKAGVIRFLFFFTGIPFILSIVEFITILTEKSDKKGEINAESERRNKTNFIASLVLFVLFILFVIIPWESLIPNFTAFADLNVWISGLKIGKFAVFNNLIGTPSSVDPTYGTAIGVIPAFGSWAMTDVAIFLLLLSIIIGIVNKIKFNDFAEAASEKIKKVLPLAVFAMLISLVLIIFVTTNVNVTIVNWILSITSKFNVVTASLATVVGSVATADFYYFASIVGNLFTTAAVSTEYYGIAAFIMQTVFYLSMIVAPTSVGLLIGLYYLDIPYGKWLKYIWKVVLIIFAIIIITSLIIYALV